MSSTLKQESLLRRGKVADRLVILNALLSSGADDRVMRALAMLKEVDLSLQEEIEYQAQTKQAKAELDRIADILMQKLLQ